VRDQCAGDIIKLLKFACRRALADVCRVTANRETGSVLTLDD
jgi:hypothetical protein